MKYYIGIDGGGTKTDCILTDNDLNILYEYTGGPSNFLLLGTEIVCETIFHLIENCISSIEIEYKDISGIVIGTTGAGRRSDAESLEKVFINLCASKLIEIKNFHVDSDARIALEGAFSGKPGSILIAGTGSIIFGKDAAGNIYRAGGFGRYIGDEGSGFMVGRKGLIAAAKAFDGRGNKTILTELIKEQFKFDTPEALITGVYKNNFDIASVAPLVLEAAELNDTVCLNIIDEETNELLFHIIAMKEKLSEKIMELSFIGGLITGDNIFSQALGKKIKDVENIILKKPDYPPAMGAVLIAKGFK